MKRILFHNFHIIFTLDYWIRQRFTKAGLLVLTGLIVAGVFGIDTRQNLAYQLFSLLLVLLLLAIINSWFFRIRLTARRHLPEIATVGKPLRYDVQVQNHTPKRQRDLTLRENLKIESPSFESFLRAKEQEKRNWFDNYIGYPRWLWMMKISKGAEIAEQSLPPIPPNDKSSITMTITPLRRGYIYFTSITFARPDPFGLFNALYTIDKPARLLVWPKRYQLNKPILLSGPRKYQPGSVGISTGDTEELISLGEYRPGVPLRHIHWKSFAKLGKPVVKEYQEEFVVRHALILDTFTDQPNSDLFEEAVSIAATFADAPRSPEILLDLMFIGTQAYRFTSGRGLAQTDQLLEILACVEACTDQPFSQLNALVKKHRPALSASMVVLLNWDDSRQQLVQSLKNAGIPLRVFVISHTEIEIDSEKFPDVHNLLIGAIAEGLAAL